MTTYYTMIISCPPSVAPEVLESAQKTLDAYVRQKIAEEINVSEFLSNCKYLTCLVSGVLSVEDVETKRRNIIFDSARPYHHYHFY